MIKQRLEGKVAQILSERELVINKGSADGVSEGAKFAVLAATPIEVRDPDTDQVLDRIDREKVRVRATEVREKVTICVAYEKLDLDALSAAVSVLLGPRRAPLTPEESYVKIGDRVREVEKAG